jgi:hypothetical protein
MGFRHKSRSDTGLMHVRMTALLGIVLIVPMLQLFRQGILDQWNRRVVLAALARDASCSTSRCVDDDYQSADAAQSTTDPDPKRFESEIVAFETQDRAAPPRHGEALFVGSSSITYWNLELAFPGRSTIKRSFGGSHVSDHIYYANRVIIPYKPQLIVFYAGDADVAANKSADRIFADYKSFIALIRDSLPTTRLILIGTKPSPAHWTHMTTIRAANALVKEFVSRDTLTTYVDVERALLGPDGSPKRELYAENGLNLNDWPGTP